MILDVTMRDGSNLHYDDVTYFNIREKEEMDEEGTYEVVGSEFYYERENDEIGKGHVINADDVSGYDLTDRENEREEAER